MISVIKKENAKMTPENFCYWLQGLLELSPDLKTMTEAQVKMVRDHLGYVFAHANPQPAVTHAPPFDLRKALADAQTAVTNPAIHQGMISIC